MTYTAYASTDQGSPVAVAVQSWQPILGGRFGEPAMEPVLTGLDGGADRALVEAAADDILRQHGFTRTGPWEPAEDGGLTASVEVSRPLPDWASDILDGIGREALTQFGALNVTAYEVTKNLPVRKVVRFRLGPTHRHIIVALNADGGMAVMPGYWITSEKGGRFQPATQCNRPADMSTLADVVCQLVADAGSAGWRRW